MTALSDASRPVLRYHGGKWLLAPWIIAHFPPHRVYTEVFGGAASVLLRKPRSYAEVYNDLDGDVVSVFRTLRDAPALLRERLELTPYSRDEFTAAYDVTSDPVERARRTIVRSFMGFGSDATNIWRKTGFRANSNRSGTTGARDWVNYPDALAAFVDRLRGVVIENRDACEVLTAHDGPETLHYVDPPYLRSTRSAGSPRQQQRYTHDLVDADHERLATTLRGLAGMVVVSGYPAPLYDALFTGWETRSIDALADGASPRTEVLWLNPTCSAALGHGPLFEEPVA